MQGIVITDERSFNELYNTYRKFVFNCAYSLCKCTFHADDVTQDVFAKIWKYKKTIGVIRHIYSFLKTVVRNKIFTKKTNIVSICREVDADEWFNYDVDERIYAKECHAIWHQSIKVLSCQQEKVYKMVINGRSLLDVANRLNIAPNTAKNVRWTANCKVRNFMHDHFQEYKIVNMNRAS